MAGQQSRIVVYWRVVKARMEKRAAAKPSGRTGHSWPEPLIALVAAYTEG